MMYSGEPDIFAYAVSRNREFGFYPLVEVGRAETRHQTTSHQLYGAYCGQYET